MLKSNKQIRAIIKQYRDSGLEHSNKKRVFGKHKIIKGQVELDTVFHLYNSLLDNDGKIPFNFTTNSKQFLVSANNLTSLWELPRECSYRGDYNSNYINQALVFTRNHPYIKTLEGITPIINGGLNVSRQIEKDFSLSNIHKYITKMDGLLSIYFSYKGPLLGTLLVPGLKAITYSYPGSASKSDLIEINSVITIMKKHLLGQRDVLECQEEFISNGLKDYAKL